jgi:hypothetical protein
MFRNFRKDSFWFELELNVVGFYTYIELDFHEYTHFYKTRTQRKKFKHIVCFLRSTPNSDNFSNLKLWTLCLLLVEITKCKLLQISRAWNFRCCFCRIVATRFLANCEFFWFKHVFETHCFGTKNLWVLFITRKLNLLQLLINISFRNLHPMSCRTEWANYSLVQYSSNSANISAR